MIYTKVRRRRGVEGIWKKGKLERWGEYRERWGAYRDNKWNSEKQRRRLLLAEGDGGGKEERRWRERE